MHKFIKVHKTLGYKMYKKLNHSNNKINNFQRKPEKLKTEEKGNKIKWIGVKQKQKLLKTEETEAKKNYVTK